MTGVGGYMAGSPFLGPESPGPRLPGQVKGGMAGSEPSDQEPTGPTTKAHRRHEHLETPTLQAGVPGFKPKRLQNQKQE